jgi:rhomboid protease GluP
MTPETENPLNALPPVVIILFLIIAGVEGALSLAGMGLIGGPGGIGWRAAAITDWGFRPAVWDYVTARGDRSLDLWRRFVTYLFVHGSATHAIFAGVMLLALGKFVGEAIGSVAVIAVFLLAGIGGAAVYGAALSDNIALIGAYPGVYGLIGAFTWVLWVRLGRRGANQLVAFRMIGFLLAAQLLFSVLFGSQPGWIADVAGCVAGFALAPVVAPGGIRALVERVRIR